jgi:hypothetical protein
MNTPIASNSQAATGTESLTTVSSAEEVEAQYLLGYRHFSGDGADKDYRLAFSLWSKAARLGHPDAQNNLAFLYATGQGVARSDKMALHWYRKSAESGNATGQFNLGKMLAQGIGVKADQVEARSWLEKSAAQGNEDAESALQSNVISLKGRPGVLLVLVAIIPWAYFYVLHLGPSVYQILGIAAPTGIRAGLLFVVVPILVPPALILWALFWKRSK